jgi:AcrB/AcrD/AcrF family protein
MARFNLDWIRKWQAKWHLRNARRKARLCASIRVRSGTREVTDAGFRAKRRNANEGMTWGREAAVRGASERLLPILMTATVTALGVLPLALASETPGREIEGPMAIIILGGLFTSTALNLLVLPSLALRYGRFMATTSDEVASVPRA